MEHYITYIEIAGVIFGLLGVILTAKENIWCWPTGIISVLLYTAFYFQKTLYASALLQTFFFVCSLIGWYQWLYGGEGNSRLKVSRIGQKAFWRLSGSSLILFWIIGLLFDRYTDNELPYWDALVTTMSFAAQWMMNNKQLECWILWIIVDIIYAVVHLQMGSIPSFVLYAAYVIFASAGYILWKQSIKTSPNTP
jgi:nicotinamide mononucleotide transporter